MKIAAIIENKVSAGGGFPMSIDLLNSLKLIAMKENFELKIYSFHKENSFFLRQLDLSFEIISDSFFDKVFAYFNYTLLGSYIQSKLKYKTFFERKLINDNIDLVIFVTPSPKPFYLQKINFACTVYDLCHRDFPEFSEVSEFNIFSLREKILEKCLRPSIFILTESEELNKKINENYQISYSKLISVPNKPTPFFEKIKIDTDLEKRVLENFKITYDYFLYPAQFWEHKNHIRIIQALNVLKQKEKKYNFIFCGIDKGNKNFILSKIEEYNLDSQIKVLNFLNHEELAVLYKNSKGVVMPTYFGPTNIPPLDAWFFKKPIFYSEHLQKQTFDAAIYFNPDDEFSLANALLKSEDMNLIKTKVFNGEIELKKVYELRAIAHEKIIKQLNQFNKRKETWK